MPPISLDRAKFPHVPRPLLAAGALLFALGYVGLAALGWGGWGGLRGLLADPARAGVCAALVVLAAATPLCGCNTSPGRRVLGSNDWIFPVLLAAGLAMGWVSPYTDRRDLYTIGGGLTRYCGLALFLAGTLLRIAAMRALGPRFTLWVAVQEGHRLQTTGLYRHVRHPAYTGALMTLFGWALTFRSLPGLLLATVAVPLLVSRARAEEGLLAAEFGLEFDTYRRKSWRLVPGVY